MQSKDQKQTKDQISRRKYLKYLGAGVVAVAVVGGAAYAGFEYMRPTPTTPTTTGKSGGTITTSIQNEPDMLDPNIQISNVDHMVGTALYHSLVEYDVNYNLVPKLAKSWEYPNPKTAIFHLRDDVKFHNGRKMTAADVKFTFDRILDPKTGSNMKIITDPMIQSTTAVDDVTFRVDFKDVFGTFLYMLANRQSNDYSIVPQDVVESQGDLKSKPCGTGPFKFAEWAKGDRIRLVRNEDYFLSDANGEKLPYADELVFRFQPDAEITLTNLKTKQIDYTNYIGYKDYVNVNTDPNLTAQTASSSFIFYYLGCNNKRKPYDDVRVRLALAHAIDRTEIQHLVFFDVPGCEGAQSFVKNPTWHSDTPMPEYDLDKAKGLLADAGLADGYDDVVVACPTFQERKMAELMQSQLGKIGVRLKIETPEITGMVDQIFNRHDFNLVVCGHPGDPDPDVIFTAYLETNGPANIVNYSNPQMDDLIEKQKHELDAAKRKEYIKQACVLMNSEPSYLWLNHATYIYASWKYLKGWSAYPDTSMILENTWIDKSLKT
jgi:peptide/nickel transport system substrate-binding protein